MPPEAATPSGTNWQSTLAFLAPTIAVIVGFVLTSWNARKFAKTVESKVDETNQTTNRIHKLVNGGRLGAALKKIDELEAELYESRANKQQSDNSITPPDSSEQ